MPSDKDGKIIIWKISNGEIIKIINAHSDTIWCLSKLSRKKVISCSSDNTIKMWEIDAFICLKSLWSSFIHLFINLYEVYDLDLLNW